MRTYTGKISVALIFLLSCSTPKKIVSTSPVDITESNLRTHISYLADDKLEGRRTGTAGERLAMVYIRNQFKNYGILPKGDSEYFQSFEVYDGKATMGSWLKINGDSLLPEKDFFVFPYSASVKMEAIPFIMVQEAAMPWFFDLKDILEENSNNPHFDLPSYIRTNSKKAMDRGASAIILYNSSKIDDKLSYDAKDKSDPLQIPVLYIKNYVAEKYLKDSTGSVELKFNTVVTEKRRTGHNVIGYIDNGAGSTVILGAHYDHLGYGEDGGSRNTSNEAEIHNGADDNASGTAALIELGRKLKSSNAVGHNYLLIAFSGEELGLFGSKYFTEHPTVDLKSVDYMINMDMVGRLNDSSRTLTIGGYGTSPAWSSVISNDYKSMHIRFDSSGTGPSDHTSFYQKGIPVLFYFTGLHSDYHKPSDDADKINYNGEVLVMDQVMNVIESLDKQPKLVFTKTRETSTTRNTKMNVSMGIMPDYTYSGAGVRADGVSEGRPAQKAGLKAGDIIIQVGDFQITSMDSYMQMLGSFNKGEKAKVKFRRGNEILETTVEF